MLRTELEIMKDSVLIAQHSALSWGEAMKNYLYLFVIIAVMVVGGIAEAQQPKKVFQMGYLSAFNPVNDPRIEGIRRALRELGYIEGQNIAFR